MKHLKWIAFFALLICGHLPACLAKDEPFTNLVAKKGVLDLRDMNSFGRQVSLNGEWTFHWQKLLTETDKELAPLYISYPSICNT